MKPIKYTIEINEPNQIKVAAFEAEASSPFMTIGKGEIINPVGFPGNTTDSSTIFVVTNVEHFIWENDTSINHKICVYTEEVDNTEELRFN